MYRTLVRHYLRKSFADLSQCDYEPLVRVLAADFRHSFPGSGPLGGVRCTIPSMRAWFQRLLRLFPDLHLEITDIVVAGPPWRTKAAASFISRAWRGSTNPYRNEGIVWLDIRWGRVVTIRESLDTARLQEACAALADTGEVEAAGAPITDLQSLPSE
jgi:ketosteroid isomerase-like protein